MSDRILPESGTVYTAREIAEFLLLNGQPAMHISLNVPVVPYPTEEGSVVKACLVSLVADGKPCDLATIVSRSAEWANSRWKYVMTQPDGSAFFWFNSFNTDFHHMQHVVKLITWGIDIDASYLRDGHPYPTILTPILDPVTPETAKPVPLIYTKTPYEVIYGKPDSHCEVHDTEDPAYASIYNGINVKGNLFSADAKTMLGYVALVSDYPFVRIELFGTEITFDQLLIMSLWEAKRPLTYHLVDHIQLNAALVNCDSAGMDEVMAHRAWGIVTTCYNKALADVNLKKRRFDQESDYSDADVLKGEDPRHKVTDFMMTERGRKFMLGA